MISTIIACIIANILTAAIVAGIAYYFYKKNETSIKETIKDVKEKINNVSSTVQIQLIVLRKNWKNFLSKLKLFL